MHMWDKHMQVKTPHLMYTLYSQESPGIVGLHTSSVGTNGIPLR